MNEIDLMKPRYRVIADYPFNKHFTVGEIAILNEFDERKHLSIHEHFIIQNEKSNTANVKFTCCFYESDFDKFPHLFKKLEWWEERKIEEMPKYVKSKYTLGSLKPDSLHAVLDWVETTEYLNHNNCPFFCFIAGVVNRISAKNLEPATESEYNEYINPHTNDK